MRSSEQHGTNLLPPAGETLASVADALRKGLGAELVQLWLREPNATTLRAIASPRSPGAPRTSRSFAVLPEAGPEVYRLPLLHEGERLGMLEFNPQPASSVRQRILPVIADIIAPFLASIELSDFKVRVLDEKKGTAAVTRVLIETKDSEKSWGTVGCRRRRLDRWSNAPASRNGARLCSGDACPLAGKHGAL